MKNTIVLSCVVLLLVLLVLPVERLSGPKPVNRCRQCITCDVLNSDLISFSCAWGANCKPGIPACPAGEVKIDWFCKCGSKAGWHD